MNATDTPPKATGQIIWDTITAMREAGQAISRPRLMEMTNLPFTKIDDHVTRWIEEGTLRRVIDGVYEVVETLPDPRAVSVTDLHNGMTLIEVGDEELRVYTPEARALARQLGGYALQYAQLQTQHDMAAVLLEQTTIRHGLVRRINELERDLRQLQQAKADQKGLF